MTAFRVVVMQTVAHRNPDTPRRELMNFKKSEVNHAIAEAMGETPGPDFLFEGGPDQQRFLAWARTQPMSVSTETFRDFSAICGEVVAFVSLLGLMERWSKNRS